MGQIGEMTGYRLESIRGKIWCVSDWCDDWLKVGQYKVRTAEWVRLV